MTKAEIIAHNEATALSKIRRAYQLQGLQEAMKLCVFYMGVTAQEAYKRVMVIVGE